MRLSARRSERTPLALASGLLSVLAACSSSEPAKQEKPAPRPQPVAARPAPAPEPEDGGVVIKGSKPRDPAADAGRDDPAVKNRERIDELKRKASEGGSTADWREFVGPDGHFKIMFPAPPTPRERTVPTASGSFVVHSAVWSKDEKRAFIVSWFDRPAATNKMTDDQVLEEVTRGQGLNGKIVETHAIEKDGRAGRESRIDAPNGITVRSRVFVVSTRIYSVVVGVPTSESGSRDVFKFLESFKVND